MWQMWKTAINMYELFSLWIFLQEQQPEEDQVSHRSSTSRLSRSPLKGVKKVKIMQCKVTLLDGSDYTVDVEVRHCALEAGVPPLIHSY